MSTMLRGTCLRSSPFQSRPASRGSLVVEANKKVQKRTKVILTKDLPNVGQEGEIKVVPVGYWRNFLLPNSLAKIANESILGAIQAKKDEEVRAKMEVKAQAQAFATALQTIGKFMLKKKAGDKDQIFGSVSVSEVSDAIYQQTGRDLKDMEFTIPDIKTTGSFECSVKLHPEVSGTFTIVIQREKGLAIVSKPAVSKPAAKGKK